MMSEAQVFEIKGNAVLNFRLRLRSDSLTVSTLRKKGGEAAKTWEVDFARVDTVRVAERIGARTRSSSIYLKPRDGELAMFAWQKNALGAPEADKQTYYAAAIATLRALGAQRPDLQVTIGAAGRSALVGAALGAIIFIGAAFIGIGEFNTTFAIVAALIAAIYTYSAATSGAFRPTRTVSLSEAEAELAANASR